MRVVAVNVFDNDLTSKGRDLPATHRPKSDKSLGARSPRPDQKNHLIEDATKQIRNEESVPLARTMKKATLEAQLRRITADADPEMQTSMRKLDTVQSELDDWLDMLAEGRQDYADMG